MSKLLIDGPLGRLLAYWRSKQRGLRLPEYGAIAPAEIPALVPHLQFVENLRGRFRYARVGRSIVEAYGVDPTGRYLEDFLPADRLAFALRNYDIVAELRCPLATQCTFLLARGGRVKTRRLLLPLIDDHGRVQMVMSGLAVDERPAAGHAGIAVGARIDDCAYALELLGSEAVAA